MAEDKGFTVHDRRRVKMDEGSAETKGERFEEAKERTSDTKRAEEAAGSKRAARPLPPVDFSGFVLGLAQMALVHLGEIPEPVTGQIQKDVDQARHTIDILDMLKEKTQGNLAREEESLLMNLRSELKMKYVKSV